MNLKLDSNKKATIKFLIKYILMLSVVLLCVNLLLFGVFCYVSKDHKDRVSLVIDIENSPLSVVMNELELLSIAVINDQKINGEWDETEYNQFLSMLEDSDPNILNVKYESKEGVRYFSSDLYDVEGEDVILITNQRYNGIDISAPQFSEHSEMVFVIFSKRMEDSEGNFKGNLEIYYQYDAFTASIFSALPKSISNHATLIYTDELQYRIVDQFTYYKFLTEIFKNQMTSITFMIILLAVSCYIFVDRSYKTLKNLILDLDRNYRKNSHGSSLIEEYHIIMTQLDEIKAGIDEKMLKISELKVVESELIQNLRYETKQFEELFKNHTVLKSKDFYLLTFFRTVINNIDQMAWLMDTDGNLLYVNQVLEEIIKFETNAPRCDHVSEFIEGFENGLDILLERDYKSIKYTFKNHIFSESLSGSSVRIYEWNKISYLLCTCSKSNFEDKMNQNYLKKSRDLHFINEIGKIVSVNNSIDVTLQEVLDKVAFLANLNLSTIRLINDNHRLELKTVAGYSTEYILEEEIPIEGRHIGQCFKENKIILINHKEDLLFHEPILEKLLDEGRTIAYIPLANYQKSFGVMSIISDLQFSTDYMVLLESISINVTISLEKVLLYDQLKANYFKTVEAFVTATEIKQERFSGHSRRVASICRLMAQRLYLNENEIDDIYISGLLHDIGKLGFADNSLEYFFDIDEHGRMGRKMIENVGFHKEILEGIEYHHLNYDLSNQSIELQEQPYYSQIIRLANDFDLFVNYNSATLDQHEFVVKMKAESGILYSPQLLKVLEDLIENQSEALKAIYDFKVSGGYYEN